MLDFQDLIKKRRSIRNYLDKNVPEETILSVIQDCVSAPSSGNEQPWKFSIVSNRKFMEEISDDCKLSLLNRIEKDPNDYAKKYKSILSKKEYNIFYNAPSVVFILGEKNLKNSEINCSLAAAYFMFSAVNKGLGTCWISFARFVDNETIKGKLGITPDLFIVAPMIIGYPGKIQKMPPRKNPEIKIVK